MNYINKLLSCYFLAILVNLILLTGAMALNLGELKVKSMVGQPLDAEVEIHSLLWDEARSISVKISPKIVYMAKGMQWNAFISTIVAEVVLDDQKSKSYIRLNSTDPVSVDKFDLDLIVTSSTGRYNKEYSGNLSSDLWGLNLLEVLAVRK
jgi:pilus assembly protein FimV